MQPRAIILPVLLGLVLVTTVILSSPWQDEVFGVPGAAPGNAGEAPATTAVAPRTVTTRRQPVAGNASDRELLPTHDAPTPRPTVRLAGRLVDDGGNPLGDVPIRLHLATEDTPAPGRQATSGADGRFCFRVPLDQGGRLTLAIDDLVFGSHAPRFVGSRDDLDLGDLVVIPGAILRGRVLTPDDQPVANARLGFVGWERPGDSPRTAESDAAGRFELRGLSGGRGCLSVSCDGYVGTVRSCSVAAGELRSDVILRLQRGVALTGHVVDDLRQPIAGALVQVTGPGRPVGNGYDPCSGSAQTDASGRFRVTGLGKGPYQVSADAKGHASSSIRDVTPESGEVRLELPRLGTITGRIVDERGEPIAGSTVFAAPATPDLAGLSGAMVEGMGSRWLCEVDLMMSMTNHGQRPESGKTDEAGRFVLADVEPGQVWLVASGAHRRMRHGPLRLDAGGRTEGIQISAVRRAVVVVGVFDPDGSPIENACVRLRVPAEQPDRRGQGRDASIYSLLRVMGTGLQGASGRTDKNGVCELVGVEPAEYEVCVTHAAWMSRGPNRLRIPAQGRIEARLVMQAGGFLAVRAVDHAGRPVAEQGFTLIPAQGPAKSGRTDTTGRAILGPLPVGDYNAVLQTTPRGPGLLTWGQSEQQVSGCEIGPRVRCRVNAEQTAAVLLVTGSSAQDPAGR